MQAIHILNGDALLDQFPDVLKKDQLIVARECLVDGPVEAESMETFYRLRGQYLQDQYQVCTVEEYLERSKSEFDKVLNIAEKTTVYLWFEDDVFCQINCWYVLSLLQKTSANTIYLVRPKEHSPYGFSAYDEEGLLELMEHKIPVNVQEPLSKLWSAYQSNDLERLSELAHAVKGKYPFIFESVQALIASIPSKDSIGRPKEILQEIMQEFGTDSFGEVFRVFNQRASIYGYGDLMVKRLYDELKLSRS